MFCSRAFKVFSSLRESVRFLLDRPDGVSTRFAMETSDQ